MRQVKLMIKTHKLTGMKYFCKTVTEGKIFECYKGSGSYWTNHLDKHGNDLKYISTEIVKTFNEDDYQLVEFALQFSKDNDIVNSNEWANLIEENGLDGGRTDYFKWDYETMKSTALKYKTKSELREHEYSCYKLMHTRGLIEELCAHMEGNIIWTEELVKEIALKYKTPHKFFKEDSPAYQAAKRLNIFDKVTSHMTKRRDWTRENILNESKNYINIITFRKAFSGAYKAARKFGIMEDVKRSFREK